MELIFETTDDYNWKTEISHETEDDGVELFAVTQENVNIERREICLYRDEAIAAAKAILSHYGISYQVGEEAW